MIAETLEAFGRLDVAVNNAGIGGQMTRTHEMAGADEPFLQEPAEKNGQFDLRSDRNGGLRPSRIGHLLAMTYHSTRGRSWYGPAGSSPLQPVK